MRTILTSILPGVIAGFLLVPCVSVTGHDKQHDKAEAVRKELDALKGTWDSTSAKTGSKEGLPVLGPHVNISGTSYTLTVGSKKLQFESGTLSIDPSKMPKTLDYSVEQGPNKGKKIQAIYELKGDDLKIAISAPGKGRPTDFSGKESAVFTYKRAQP